MGQNLQEPNGFDLDYCRPYSTTVPPPATSSPLAFLEAFPPLKVRLMAKTDAIHVPVAITHAEFAIAGGFTLQRVLELSRMMNWDEMTLGEFKRFCAVCGFNPLSARDRARLSDYESKCIHRQSRPFQWLTRSPAYQTEFLPLIRLLSQPARSPAQHVA